MSSAAKRRLIEALDSLPEESLASVAEFVDALRAKAVGGPVVRTPEQAGKPSKGFAETYAAWRSGVAADDLDEGTGYFDSLRDTSPGPDVTL
jgi:hypothetical protein